MSILDRWNNFKRVMLLLCSILMWMVSIVFSYIGFKSDVRNEWYFAIFALILSASVTALELYLNSQTFDFEGVDFGLIILWIGGLFAYAYGIWTNIIGVATMMLGSSDLNTVRWSVQVVPIIVGVLLEVLPEPMFVAFLKSKMVKKQQPNQQNFKSIPVPPPHHPKSDRRPDDIHMDDAMLARLRRTQPNAPYKSR